MLRSAVAGWDFPKVASNKNVELWVKDLAVYFQALLNDVKLLNIDNMCLPTSNKGTRALAPEPSSLHTLIH